MDMSTMITLRRVSTPTTPTMKSNAPNTKYHDNGTNGFLQFVTG